MLRRRRHGLSLSLLICDHHQEDLSRSLAALPSSLSPLRAPSTSSVIWFIEAFSLDGHLMIS